jgi:hypothetical protein
VFHYSSRSEIEREREREGGKERSGRGRSLLVPIFFRMFSIWCEGIKAVGSSAK